LKKKVKTSEKSGKQGELAGVINKTKDDYFQTYPAILVF
jgi:hypothetical protein